jgi:hypothetical protein
VTFEQLIQQQRPHIEQVIRDLARRNFLAPPEIDEFRAAVIGALERNDFELLRAFDGRSTWETYLQLVISREFFLFQMDLWGQWRPSAAARRLGAAGVLLEELVIRDRMLVTEAIETMRTRHRVDMPRYRMMQMAERLRLTAVGPAPLSSDSASAPPEPLDPRVQSALREALAALAPDDRLIAELRFRDAQPLTRIAKMMNMEVRPVQRRLDHAKRVIGASLLAQGIVRQDVEALLAHAETGAGSSQHKWWQTVLSRPSNKRNGPLS